MLRRGETTHNRRLFYILLCVVLLSALTITLCSAALGIDMQGALNFTRLMLLVFLATLLTSFLLREYRSLRTRLEREQLQRLAYTDLLTGIPNRQALERRAEELSAQEAERCAVLFFDANGLKKANAVFGHAAGDTMLREVGQRRLRGRGLGRLRRTPGHEHEHAHPSRG